MPEFEVKINFTYKIEADTAEEAREEALENLEFEDAEFEVKPLTEE